VVPVERRKFERVPLHESVVVVDEAGESLLGEASDISVGGMFIEGVMAPFASRVTVHLHFTGSDWAIELPAVVRWNRKGGIGIQFALLGARETYAIAEAIGRAKPSHTRQRSAPPVDGIEIVLDLDELDEACN
jgi:hypothetical protein